jgi:mannose-6-phosphate isomerase-like protein (cupin superfamily)
MAESGVVVCNWQDKDPRIGHESAVIWPVLLRRSEENKESYACLEQISGLHRYAMQGRKKSDYHAHDTVEQYYYILSGEGEVLIDGETYPVREGSVAYFAPGAKHQLINEQSDEWLEQLIISCPVERQGSTSQVVNWRDSSPTAGVHGAAITWNLLESVDVQEPSTEKPCLLGMYYIARQALVRGKAADNHKHDDKEQIYYILEGWGTVITADEVHQVAEGDSVYLPQGVSHQIINEDCDGWLSYLVIS